MALTVKRIAKLNGAGRYSDGGNLFLQVTPTGVKSWLFKYQHRGREREMGLGPLRDFTLDEARQRALKARQMLRDGIDPLEVRTAERAAQALEAAKAKTFEQAAKEYFDGHQQQWSNAHYRQKFLSSLKMYAFDRIGKLPVAAIDTGLVLKVIEPIWLTKPDTANRVRGRIENISGLGHRSRPAHRRQSGAMVRPPRRGVARQDTGIETSARPALRRRARLCRPTRRAARHLSAGARIFDSYRREVR